MNELERQRNFKRVNRKAIEKLGEQGLLRRYANWGDYSCLRNSDGSEAISFSAFSDVYEEAALKKINEDFGNKYAFFSFPDDSGATVVICYQIEKDVDILVNVGLTNNPKDDEPMPFYAVSFSFYSLNPNIKRAGEILDSINNHKINIEERNINVFNPGGL